MPIDFRIRDHLSPLALVRLSRSMARLERADPAELRAYQAARLREVLGHAAHHVPFWRERFAEADFDPRSVRGPEDLARLPLLDRELVRGAGDALRSSALAAGRMRARRTSGTTGRPLTVWAEPRADTLEFCYYRRAWGWAGFRLGAVFLELGGHHFLAPGRDPDRLVHWQPVLRRLMVNTNRLSPRVMGEVRAAVARHRPRFLKGLPSALEHLAGCVAEDGRGPLGFRALFSGGEVVTPRTRLTVERAFDARLFDSYGHMEQTMAASQCEEGRYHVHGDYGVLELHDVRPGPDGRPIGDVVGTGLHNRAMPLVRYTVGDLAEVDRQPAPCPCGRTLPTIGPILGRRVDVVRTPDGRALTALSTAFDGTSGVQAMQVIQQQLDRVELRVVTDDSWSAAGRADLLARCARALGSGVRLELREVQEQELRRDVNGKLRPLIGLPAAQAAEAPQDSSIS